MQFRPLPEAIVARGESLAVENELAAEAENDFVGRTTMDVLRTAFQTSLVLEWGATAATASR